MKKPIKKFLTMLIAVSLTFSVFAGISTASAANAQSRAGIVSTTWGNLNVRSSASTNGTVVTTLSKGSYVTLLYRMGNWWKVEYASGGYGYVSASYTTAVTLTETATVNLSYGYLNVRTGVGTSNSIITQLAAGKSVVVLSYDSGWAKILYNGNQIGYVSAAYLEESMTWPAPMSTTVTQGFISGSHLGIDISSTEGDGILAACAGEVVYAGWLSGYGYVVYINSSYNGQYIQTRYAHLCSAPLVSAGDYVSTGQIIGYAGSTGVSTGVHLHFEVRIRSSSDTCLVNSASTAVNPMNYVN